MRGALFAVRLCGMDLLRLDGAGPVSLAQSGAGDVAAVSRLGPSLDDADLPGRSHSPHSQFMDGPARAFLDGPGGDSGRRSAILPLAQAPSHFHRSRRA